MNTYVIGYDLNRPRQADDYPKLIEAIKAYGTWWHNLDSTWLIQTEASVAAVRDNLSTHLDNGDELLVIQVIGTWASWGFSDDANDWLKDIS
jgi:hypothetical protein